MNKKAQVTIFIIIAILIISGIVLFFILNGNINKKGSLQVEINPIHNYVQECIRDVSEQVIYNVGQGGGYYFPPKFSTNSGVTYYILNGKNYMPSKKIIEKEISDNIEENIFLFCTNFTNFTNYSIQQGNLSIKTLILDSQIKLNVNFPLTIKKENSSALIRDFDINFPIRFGIMYTSAQQIINSSSKDICLNCLLDISKNNNLYIDIFDYSNNVTIFTITDNHSKLNNVPIKWIFANKY